MDLKKKSIVILHFTVLKNCPVLSFSFVAFVCVWTTEYIYKKKVNNISFMGHLIFEGNLYNVNHLIDFIAIYILLVFYYM